MSIKAGVIGHPIGHSKSPLIHNYWIEKHGLQGSYETIDIAPEELEPRVRSLIAQGYAGFNVTVPHKEAIFTLCDHVDDLARAVGAVNTVTIRDGKLHGTNTDVFGFIENIKQHQNDYNFAAGKAIVLGAGGAARAVVKGLVDNGVQSITVINRTVEKAEKIAEAFSSQTHMTATSWAHFENHSKGTNLLVNTTSLGMVGIDPLDADLCQLPQETLVTDIVYAPLMTDLLKAAQARGNPVVTGIGMLLHQARPAFEQWFGVLPQVDAELEKLVLS